MLTKPIIKNFAPQDERKILNFQLPNTKAGKIDIDIAEYSLPMDIFITRIKDSDGNTLASETFCLDESDDMYGYNIEVEEKIKGKSLGELLRLTSIIEMLENKIKQLRIYSKSAAIYFHSKYKFEPDISDSTSARREAVTKVMRNQSEKMKRYALRAEEIMKKIENIPTYETDKQAVLSEQSNQLLKEYIQEILKNENYKDFPFDLGFNMKLTRETVLKNADFFNNLFKKHGIEYEIPID